MSKTGNGTVVFIESNTTGTGWLFILAARKLGLSPVLITARPEKYTYLSKTGAPDVIVVPRMDNTEIEKVIRDRSPEGIKGITSTSEYFITTAAQLAVRFRLPGPDPERVRSVR